MKDKSELRREVLELLDLIDVEHRVLWKRIEALNELRAKGIELGLRLELGSADRGTVESVGAWMDDVRLDG